MRWQETAPRAGAATAAWDEVAWGSLPPGAIILLTDDRMTRRALAARARGALGEDVTLVEAHGISSRAEGALRLDASLVPLWRDIELTGTPSEASLSLLASQRPVFMVYEPAWARAVAKHLVPVGLFDQVVPEPRGTSDRRHALEAFAPVRQRLARAIAKDRELEEVTAYALRARAIELLALGDRDLVGAAVEDLHAFAAHDAVATEIVSRLERAP